MRLTLIALGSRGDVQPTAAPCRGTKRAEPVEACALVLMAAIILTACQPKPVLPNLETVYDDEPYVLSLPAVDPQAYAPLFDYDDQAPLDVREDRRWQEDAVTWIDLTYLSPHGGRVPATLALPAGRGPFAGVLLMHGMPSDRESLAGLAAVYAQAGAAALMIDAPFNRPENARRTWISGIPLDFTAQDRQDQIQLIVDLRRGVDLLSAYPNVDPARLAYLGISYGGAMGGLLAGVEPRLKAYVLIVGDGGLVTHLAGLDDLHNYPRGLFFRLPAETQRAWVDLMWPIEPVHYVGRAAPAALLFQNGTRDVSVPPLDAARYQQAGSQPKKALWYELGHNLAGDSRVLEDQFAFLQSHIGAGALALTSAFSPDSLWLDRALLAWPALVLVSLGALGWGFVKTPAKARGARLFWILTVLLTGPLGWLVYRLVGRNRMASAWQAVLAEATGDVLPAAFVFLFTLAVLILVPALGSNLLVQILLVASLPLLVGWPCFHGLWLRRAARRGYLRTLWQRLPHAWATVNLGTGGLTALAASLVAWLFRSYVIMPLYPWAIVISWMIVAVGGLAAILLLLPYEIWAVRHGFRAWSVVVSGDGEVTSPPWRKAWWWIVLSYAVLLGCVLASVVIQQWLRA